MNDGLEILDDEESLDCLARATIGRVGISVGALPMIVPVNYVLLDGAVVFRTGEGTKLRAALENAVIAFEVDEIDSTTRAGWSVLVVGQAEVTTARSLIERASAAGLSPWAGGARDHYVRIAPGLLSGRRIVHQRAP